jgi:hypothetical protein
MKLIGGNWLMKLSQVGGDVSIMSIFVWKIKSLRTKKSIKVRS